MTDTHPGQFSADAGEPVRLNARVSGVVQAVGFRYWTVRKAEDLGLTGTVRNNDDGSVGIVAEGPQPLVLELRRWLRSAEAPGRVEDVQESVSAATGAFTGFRVVY
ncbi:acylphosphatase [Arthrobacter sp. H-02-3]|uniref:acylphosphatase n=1 Tax=Arthrobacter sp. H-02-3 TaxID=2703675 RepID=UPI000DD23DE3|nr:acylphosphatase [Arthrobacter sp. H-02-3]PVZ53658.1 acylphosphatase [Arthrobacter sp. H-02-3]